MQRGGELKKADPRQVCKAKCCFQLVREPLQLPPSQILTLLAMYFCPSVPAFHFSPPHNGFFAPGESDVRISAFSVLFPARAREGGGDGAGLHGGTEVSAALSWCLHAGGGSLGFPSAVYSSAFESRVFFRVQWAGRKGKHGVYPGLGFSLKGSLN